jgi:4'-phosphopantetheinyl transferase
MSDSKTARPRNHPAVQVWRIILAPPSPRSTEETDNLRRQSNRVLRAILGAYAGTPAEQVQLTQGQGGKPEVRPSSVRAEPLHFNLARSAGRCLVAVSRAGPIGVDLEQVTDFGDVDRIATRFFTAIEASAIRAEQGDEKLQTFYRCWTRKEAYAKAIGGGLAVPFDRFTVSTGASANPSIVNLTDDDPDAWTLRHLAPWAGFTGAFAIRQRLADSDWQMNSIERPEAVA